ncbi:MAG: amino acid permease [Xanthomonadales bacterium]|nr:amino acid permease [Xanthomonadales bacterium]
MPLKRQFGLWTAAALIVGQVIAVGIFLTPAGMVKAVQSPTWLLAIWLLIGSATICGALSYSELSARYPESGGTYAFLREAFGPSVAFLYGWVVLLVIDPGLTAAFAVGLANYFSYITPLSPSGQTVLAVAVVWVAGAVNIRGARLGAGIMRVLIAIKIGVLLFLVLYGFLAGRGDWDNLRPFFASPPDWLGALIAGSVGAYFAFGGWWDATRIAGEIKNPQKNLPRALLAGVGALTAMYILISAVFYYLVPVSEVTDETTFAAQAGQALFGATGGAIFAAIVVVSVLGTLFAFLMASPRVYYAMARNGLFFKAFGVLHPRWETPHLAILIQISLATLLIATGSFDQIVSYFFMIAIAFPALAVAGLFLIRRQRSNGFQGFRTPWYPYTPLFFLLVTLFVGTMLLIRDPWQSLAGVAVVLAGIPVYWLVFRRSRSN